LKKKTRKNHSRRSTCRNLERKAISIARRTIAKYREQ
jgi:DNA-directed RNA polymerase specialized sigma54-like protein